MNTKIAWGVVNKGTNNITEGFMGGYPSGMPAIFKTRGQARQYVRDWHGAQRQNVYVRKVAIMEAVNEIHN